MDFTDIETTIPQAEPNIQIGPISIWITGVYGQGGNPDRIVLDSPFLYKSTKVRIYSAGSQITGFEIIHFAKVLADLYDSTGDKVTEMQFDEAEFKLTLTKNALGQIEVETKYWAWGNPEWGNLIFKDKIDQTYLPNIIKQFKAAQSFLK